MNRKLGVLHACQVLLMAWIGCIAGPASAAEPPATPVMPQAVQRALKGPADLLAVPEVAHLLGLTEQQRTQIARQAARWVAQIQSWWQQEAGRGWKADEQAVLARRMRQQYDQSVRRIVEPHQWQRLMELYRQSLGVQVLEDRQVVEELGLSVEQQLLIRRRRTELLAQRRDFLPAGQVPEPKQLDQLRRSLQSIAQDVLRPDQWQKLQSLLGEPADLPRYRQKNRPAGR